jgi:hypothetical protein
MNLPSLSSRRLRLLGVLGATALVASCDTTVGFRPNELLWGFVSVNAVKDGAGANRANPAGVFFRGEVTSLPSATVRPDSCYTPRAYIPPSENQLSGVTYLDAGPNVNMTLGGVANDIPRVSSGGVTTYRLGTGTSLAYNPGDSVLFRVPGVTGGYPTTEIRGRTAEAFTLTTPPAVPTGDYMQLRWTPATDGNSAMLISLQYAPAGGSGTVSQEIICAFVDDGVDSIAATKIAQWTNATNVTRQYAANRLRTVLQNIQGGAIQFTSTYTVPTPVQ